MAFDEKLWFLAHGIDASWAGGEEAGDDVLILRSRDGAGMVEVRARVGPHEDGEILLVADDEAVRGWVSG